MSELQATILIFGAIVLAIGVVGARWAARRQRQIVGDKANRSKSCPDPVAEAEVYLAYGRKRQAVQLLEKALWADATRTDVQALLAKIKRES